MTPFAINNFIQGRFLMGIGSSAVIILCTVSAWQSALNRYQPSLILWGLVPTITLFLVLAFRQQGLVVSYWAFPAILSFYFMLPRRQAWLANLIFLAFILPQAWMTFDFPIMMRFCFTILAASAFSAMFVQVISDQQKTLEQHIVTDPLTGLFNRLLLNEVLEQTVHQNNRTSTPMTLVAFDLDHFKVINDTLGHADGDKVLRGIGEFFKARIRRTDKVFRIGGEEFLVLLYDTGDEDGKRLATELCNAIASLELLPYSKVTVSAGVATLRPGEYWEEWMKRCDENLYQAKRDGRNRVATDSRRSELP